MSRDLSDVRFLTVAEVAEMMRVSKMTVYRLVHSGDLPAIRFGRSFRVPESAVLAAIEAEGLDHLLHVVTQEWPQMLGLDAVAVALFAGDMGVRADASGLQFVDPRLIEKSVGDFEGVLLRGVERAAALGAREAEFVNDSELVAKQINGLYRVKHPAMKPLYDEAIAALRRNFEDRWRIRSVPRAENARADALVNEALDGQR